MANSFNCLWRPPGQKRFNICRLARPLYRNRVNTARFSKGKPELMRAILLPEHGTAEKLVYTTSHPIPTPGAGEVRIRVYAAALNRLDIWVRNGWPGLKLPMPHIPGADAAGKIDALGAGVDGWAVGDRVVINPSFSCGRCEFCRAGHENLCASGGILGEEASGTFAEYIVVPARNLLKMPDA